MQKLNKKMNTVVVSVLMFSLLAMYAFTPLARAASLTEARDLISDSNVSATGVTHDFYFTTGENLSENEYIEITLPGEAGEFSGLLVGNVTCPANTDADLTHVTDWVLTCTVQAGQTIVADAQQVSIGTTTNPTSAGSQTINIVTKDALDAEIEKAEVKVYIIENISVSATVQASLTFAVTGLDAGETVNGIETTGTSTATTVPFGTLDVNASTTIGQELTVGTNATDGYTVTVQQDGELESAAGAIINSFNNQPVGQGTASAAWTAPTKLLADDDTWGHMGLTSDDDVAAFSGANDGNYAGLAGVVPTTIMSHDGPSDEVTSDVGLNRVAYTVEITALQEAGDYTSTLTYVCTPQF